MLAFHDTTLRPPRQDVAVTGPWCPRRYAARARRERDLHLRILQRRGVTPDPAARVLDFGCGSGASVHAYLEAGFDAWGCDIVAPDRRSRRSTPRHRSSPYRLPFGDGEFDLVYSEQVFEHVMNPDQAIRELSRVASAARRRPASLPVALSPHRVPCPRAARRTFRPRWWLALWARLGVRNEFQRGLGRTRRSDETNAFFTMRRTTWDVTR